MNGNPDCSTSPEALVARHGPAKALAAARWAKEQGKSAAVLVSGLQQGYAELPEVAVVAKPGDTPLMTPEERARFRWQSLKSEVRLRTREARKVIYQRVTEAEWDQLEAEVEREAEREEAGITPQMRAEAHFVRAVTAAACGRLAWTS